VTESAIITSKLEQGLQALGIAEPDQHLAAFTQFLTTLHKWNQAYNLTAVRDVEEMVARHILDSCSLRPWLVGKNILDVGTGAGLPGIPLAILEPERHFTLLDSNGKKTRFVTHVAAEIGLDNVEVVQARAEEFLATQKFDTVMCRAFSSLQDFVGQCAAHLQSGGRLLAMKGKRPDAELAALPAEWEIEVVKISVPTISADRHIAILHRRT